MRNAAFINSDGLAFATQVLISCHLGLLPLLVAVISFLCHSSNVDDHGSFQVRHGIGAGFGNALSLGIIITFCQWPRAHTTRDCRCQLAKALVERTYPKSISPYWKCHAPCLLTTHTG